MSNLIEIASKYKSTKKMMGFIDIYNYYFNTIKDKNLNIFEIGVETGESLRMFSDYFNKSNIVGLDIENKDYNIERVEIFCGDQSDKKILNRIIEKYKTFDVIIDDGSHKNKDVINRPQTGVLAAYGRRYIPATSRQKHHAAITRYNNDAVNDDCSPSRLCGIRRHAR